MTIILDKLGIKVNQAADGAHASAYFRSLLSRSGASTGIAKVDEATWPSFQAAKENVTRALPRPASSGTRTGPWKMLPQQN
jgi:hypothetical protein